MTANPFAVLEIEFEVSIAAPRERVWDAFVHQTSSWWPKDFYTCADPRGFHIEPKLGGRIYEDWGDDQGLIWATVTGLRHGEMIQATAELSPEFGGPARIFHIFELETEGKTTQLRLKDCVYGSTSEKTRASLEAGWKHLIVRCLKPFVEEGKQAEIPPTVG